ncbi:single-stranded DNA-binding protein [uncultured Pseudoalteromonas sp.]|uniref:single-stranded DNA-binding protein n=1 Tax=uncultured Pseudoalteromonas sp. TaxID=114053 RepID=UPI00259A916C|nr:single-stranded DNA-binding protein [uncultured Pseudoalteromonas sp.]
MRTTKHNEITLGGRVSAVDIKASTQVQNEFFGSVTLAIDDGYFKKAGDNQSREWVERTYFHELKVNNRVLSLLKTAITVGDELAISGKLIQEKWVDKNTQQNRSASKVEVQTIISHLSKAEIECLKSNGFGNQSNQGQQNAPAPQQQGGYGQHNAPAPQQQGGYGQQNAPAPQQQGGYGQQNAPAPQQQQGGFAPKPSYGN